MNNKLMQLLKRSKWFVITIITIISVIIVFIILSSSTPPQKTESVHQIQPITSPLPTKSAQEIKAISDQTKEDEKFANWERTTLAQYPWINRIPLRTDSYFVYFELERARFIGLLYPKAGEDLEGMKAEIMTQLKEIKGIPADNFEFKWTVFPE